MVTFSNLTLLIFSIVAALVTTFFNPSGTLNSAELKKIYFNIQSYKGQIVDNINNKPLEGVSVLIWWSIYIPHFEGTQKKMIDAHLLTTDSNGKYQIPKRTVNTSIDPLCYQLILRTNLPVEVAEVNIVIYQPGYRTVVNHGQYKNPSFFLNSNPTINLERISPLFDHSKHLETLRKALPDSYRGELEGLSSIRNKILTRADWEVRRFYLSEQERGRYRVGKEDHCGSEIEKQFADSSADVRKHAARELGFCRDHQGMTLLLNALNDNDVWVRYEAAFSLGEMNFPEAILPLLKVIEENEKEWPHTLVKQEALKAINKIIGPDIIEFIVDSDSKEPTFENIIKISGQINSDILHELAPVLLSSLKQQFQNEYLKDNILLIFEYLEALDTFHLVEESTRHPYLQIRRHALTTYLRLTLAHQQTIEKSEINPKQENKFIEKAFSLLVQSLNDPNAAVRAESIRLLGLWKKNDAIDLLINMLRDEDQIVREMAIEVLKEFESSKILEPLVGNFEKDCEAKEVFLSIALKTADSHAYITRQNGKRYVSNVNPFPSLDPSSFFWKTSPYQCRINHPAAVKYLLDSFESQEERGKLAILDLLCMFEDRRIAKTISHLPLGTNKKINNAILKTLECSDDGSSISVVDLPVKSSNKTYSVSKNMNGVGKGKIQSISNNRGVEFTNNNLLLVIKYRNFLELNDLGKYYKDRIVRSVDPVSLQITLKKIQNENLEHQEEAVRYLVDNADKNIVDDAVIPLLSSPNKHAKRAVRRILDDLIHHPVLVFYLYEKLLPMAEEGNVIAQYFIAKVYIETTFRWNGIQRDEDIAEKWLKRAAQENYAPAQFELGRLYDQGYLNKEDPAIALRWYKKAAKQGSEKAQYRLGRMHHYGLGIEKDLTMAYQWYVKAAEQGDKDAQRELANMYFYGRPIQKDFTCALKWFHKASLQEDTHSSFMIGEIYRKGLGVQPDYDMALLWYQKAQKKGHVHAAQAIRFLLSKRENYNLN